MIGYNSLIILKPNSFIIIVIIFGLITQLEVMIVDAIILKKVNNEIKKTLIDAIFRFYRIQLFERRYLRYPRPTELNTKRT